jgi:DNA repair exonuclease SbcCD ATPase subunit
LQGTRQSLIALQPDLLEGDQRRVQRAMEQNASAKSEAEQNRAAARAHLQRDGVSDPQADLAFARSKAQFAKDHRVSLERKAAAISMLHGLFKEEHRALAEQFTAPLAEKITGYLKCLFGADARASVILEDNQFTKVRLMRGSPPTSFDFEGLSGGTCEQLAAAVRLAIAEVLAESHGGSLPIVFDDAFAYSDPERVRVLQRMLDRGAAQGLQIIIVTCNPLDYAALGAKQVLLRS